MKICLITNDKRLARLCREVLEGMAGVQYDCALGESVAGPADLYLRDFDWPEAVPPGLDPGDEVGNLFLVRPADLAAFHRRVPASTAAVLLKPVKRAALASFVERAVERSTRSHRPAPAEARDACRAERDELLECVLLASLKLQQHSVERNNFLARALHDFRAPLTAASGYCALLIDQAIGPLNRDQVEILERMQHSIQRLSKMAKTVFQLSIGQMDEAETCLEPGDIGACIEQAVYEIMPPAEARGIDLSIRIERAEADLFFDASQVEQVLVNLLENACKFTPSHGSIEVAGYPVSWKLRNFRFLAKDGAWYRPLAHGERPNAYRIDVSDSGPGVPQEDIGHIFEQSVSYSGSQDRSGTGLGLATCRMIIAAHHGEILVDPRREGATFSFVLPFIRREAQDEAAACGAGNAYMVSVSHR